ncbi:hypothetical protein GLGCALEP_04235 [Pseudomonas sp. MM221]|nr:hypothetical protein GLGCALEP_04235 [Pseudomonas sp. MM221]
MVHLWGWLAGDRPMRFKGVYDYGRPPQETHHDPDQPRTLVASPPKPGQKEQDLHWGYLEIYADGRTVFVDQRPSDRELAERKSRRNFPDHEL